MFTSSNGGGVIIAGGLNYDGDQSDVIELRAGEKNWTYLEQKLSQNRSSHVIIPLP